MQQQQIIEDHGFAPSFSIYSTDTITSRAIAKVIHEEDTTRFNHTRDVNEEEFEFTLVLTNEDELVKHSSSSKSKKSSSTTRSGSKRWIFKYLLGRSKGEAKEPKKVDSPKHNSRIVQWKAQTPVHEQFYVQRRAENEVGKKRSYLPYRTALVF